LIKNAILNHVNSIKTFLNLHNDYQTSLETCWWLRVELRYGKNVHDEEKFEDFLKWTIRSQASKPVLQGHEEGSTIR
jgi:hypothetical protein